MDVDMSPEFALWWLEDYVETTRRPITIEPLVPNSDPTAWHVWDTRKNIVLGHGYSIREALNNARLALESEKEE